MLDRWILAIKERRSWIILRMAGISEPASPGAWPSQVTVRSPGGDAIGRPARPRGWAG